MKPRTEELKTADLLGASYRDKGGLGLRSSTCEMRGGATSLDRHLAPTSLIRALLALTMTPPPSVLLQEEKATLGS